MDDQSTLRDAWTEEARELGREHARSAATWTTDGNTKREFIPDVLRMLEEGDPQADDYLPARPNLSGEWADDLTPDTLATNIIDLNAYGSISWGELADVQNALADAYEEGVSEVFRDACETELRNALGEES